MSVRRAQREIDSREFSEWQAYYRLEPFGYDRHDLNNGILCSLVANALGGKKSKSYKPEDFMPKFDRKRKQTDTDMGAVVQRALEAARSAKDRRRGQQQWQPSAH